MIYDEIEADNAPTPNVPLLRKVVEWVEAEDNKPYMQREWLQADWMRRRTTEEQAKGWCGTACCVAGWVGMHSDVAQPQLVHNPRTGEMDYSGMMEYPDGLLVHVEDYAQHVLGLNDVQAGALFAGGNGPATIRKLAEEFAGEAL